MKVDPYKHEERYKRWIERVGVKAIVEDYSSSHTYSLVDLFVCTDTSIDIWNLVKTEGINAQICVGNVDEELNYSNYDTLLGNMNHAWVIAEAESFKWVALETTGGYLVWGKNMTDSGMENDLYYSGTCFDNPKEFKEFLSLRNDYLNVCNKYEEMRIDWNENYVGTHKTDEALKCEGQIDQKGDECVSIINQLNGIII